jgi:predicted ArsR family transcriptional regulator
VTALGGANSKLLNYRPFPEAPTLIQILEYLKKHGQRLDTEIAKEMGLSVTTVRQRVASLRATGEVITCDLTRFENGKQTQAWVCRASGYTPPPAPGRKAKPIAKTPS